MLAVRKHHADTRPVMTSAVEVHNWRHESHVYSSTLSKGRELNVERLLRRAVPYTSAADFTVVQNMAAIRADACSPPGYLAIMCSC